MKCIQLTLVEMAFSYLSGVRRTGWRQNAYCSRSVCLFSLLYTLFCLGLYPQNETVYNSCYCWWLIRIHVHNSDVPIVIFVYLILPETQEFCYCWRFLVTASCCQSTMRSSKLIVIASVWLRFTALLCHYRSRVLLCHSTHIFAKCLWTASSNKSTALTLACSYNEQSARLLQCVAVRSPQRQPSVSCKQYKTMQLVWFWQQVVAVMSSRCFAGSTGCQCVNASCTRRRWRRERFSRPVFQPDLLLSSASELLRPPRNGAI